jgi:hypothetical protein
MPSATLTLVNLADANQVYSLVGSSDAGAVYKIAAQPLATPKTLSFKYQLGAPGSLGNDRMIVTLSDSRQNADTAAVKTASVILSVSIPRDAAITNEIVVDLLCQMTSLLSDARNANIADAVVP